MPETHVCSIYTKPQQTKSLIKRKWRYYQMILCVILNPQVMGCLLHSFPDISKLLAIKITTKYTLSLFGYYMSHRPSVHPYRCFHLSRLIRPVSEQRCNQPEQVKTPAWVCRTFKWLNSHARSLTWLCSEQWIEMLDTHALIVSHQYFVSRKMCTCFIFHGYY